MLILKALYWNNCFSYGADNYLRLDGARVTQLVGKNGHGKSSIPLILQEILYNKNSKGIKKADVKNRFTDKKEYDIGIEFELNGKEYFFTIERKGATTKTELLCDAEEIGSHTATATYKQVAELLGMDFSTFCQLVYQSTTTSLEFLTATDTQRKKFLISLLNLGDYTAKEIILKQVYSEVNKELIAVQSSVETIESWLSKNTLIETISEELQEVPEDPKNLREQLATLRAELSAVESLNDRYKRRKTTEEHIARLEPFVTGQPPAEPDEDLGKIKEGKGKVSSIKSTAQALKTKMQGLGDKCPTCLSNINKATTIKLIEEQNVIIEKCIEKEGDLVERQQNVELQMQEIAAYKKYKDEYEKYLSMLDVDAPTEPVSKESIEAKISNVLTEIAVVETAIAEATAFNKKVQADIDRASYIREQNAAYTAELAEKQVIVDSLQRRVGRLEILKRAFSTKGLVAYKIESMIKDLEKLINKYLIEMSDGRFNLAFVVNGDKLNVDILDNGNPITITALSSGELARVNISTLLAIRKLMNSLSNTRLNLLFLDEVTSVLDDEGKERLVEILNAEEDINAFIVSHGWQHPLVSKIEVIKENNISRIESNE